MVSMQQEEEKAEAKVKLGPKSFHSSMDMFHYFYNLLHLWPHNLNLNKFEHLALLDLLKKGHTDAENKMRGGGGIRGFQVGKHPLWKSRCFFLIKQDYSVEDFSFRKCVHHILPLPQHMINPHKSHVNKPFIGGTRGGRGRRAHGKGGRSRH